MSLIFRNKLSIVLPWFRVRNLSQVSSGNLNQNAILNFGDFQAMYQYKTNWELLRSLLILRTCSINYFVDNSLTLMKTGERVLGGRLFPLVLRPTFYRQFVGGDTEKELIATTETLAKSKLRLMVCPVQEEDVGEAVESEDKYDANKDYIMHTAQIMTRTCSPTPNLQLKVTAFMPGDLVTRLSGLLLDNSITMESLVETLSRNKNFKIEKLSEAENGQLSRGMQRMSELIQFAKDQGLKILVDAEYTYMNPGISAVALAMMVNYNTSSAVVGNTYQCYLKEALNTIKREKGIVDKMESHFGAKIVRGAYMEKERKLAKLGGYPDPVNDTYDKTGEMYNRVIDFLLDESISNPKDLYVVVATHNEGGAFHAVDEMKKRGIDSGKGHFVFGQIYGMGEQLSMPLANAGYSVYKSVPYGPMSEVLPYLSRRAAENRSVMAGARRERELLRAELKRRIKSSLKFF